jgi:Flp pilus assembly protein TadD
VRRDLARILSLAGHHDEAGEHTRFALHAARTEGNRTSTVFALGVWAHLLRRTGDVDGALAALLEAAELAERSSAFLGAVDADIAATLLLRGEVDEAESRLGRVPPVDAPERSFRFVLGAWIALHRGRLDDARVAWALAGAGELAHVRQHAEITEWEVHLAATGRERGLIRDLSDLD